MISSVGRRYNIGKLGWGNEAVTGFSNMANENGMQYSGQGASNAAWPTANLAFFFPFAVNGLAVVNKVGWVNGSTVSGNVDAGIYRPDGTRIVSLGSTAQTPINVLQTATLTETTLTSGVYFFALVCDNTTAIFARFSAAATTQHDIFGIKQMAAAFALPATATFAVVSVNYAPRWFLFSKV
jgi:hypothetical protein